MVKFSVSMLFASFEGCSFETVNIFKRKNYMIRSRDENLELVEAFNFGGEDRVYGAVSEAVTPSWLDVYEGWPLTDLNSNDVEDLKYDADKSCWSFNTRVSGEFDAPEDFTGKCSGVMSVTITDGGERNATVVWEYDEV